jgi:energy-coupling factor transporter ATP-binding protein EcfA2
MSTSTLRSVDLDCFKAFKRFTAIFDGSAYIVGPNSAGKSTLLQAIRAAAHMIRIAGARAPETVSEDRDREVLTYAIGGDQLPIVTDNIRHEFADRETRLQLEFTSGARLTAVWPQGGDAVAPSGFFYLVSVDGTQPRRPKDVSTQFPRIGIVPPPAPLENVEPVLHPETLRRNEDSRLASRHFRNHLHSLRNAKGGDATYRGLMEYFERWTPELRIHGVRSRPGTKGLELDVFYTEIGSRVEKELVWCGDGLQIWLQILFHLYRCREHPVVVLDEPEVYLHADLQRRLVRVLEDHAAQTVLATHSAEVLAEAPSHDVIWVERSRARSVSAPRGAALDDLSAALGTNFNLRLAKALRARVAVFVESDDLRLLRYVAGTLGHTRVGDEAGVALIPVGGYANWDQVEPFVWLVERLLEDSVRGFVLLDRKNRPETVLAEVTAKLVSSGLRHHVWRRCEFESYLIVPPAIARLAGASVHWVEEALDAVVAEQEAGVFAKSLQQHLRLLRGAKADAEAALAFKESFDCVWANEPDRLGMCEPAEVMSGLNRRLVAEGYRNVSPLAIARTIRADELVLELKQVIAEIEDLARD